MNQQNLLASRPRQIDALLCPHNPPHPIHSYRQCLGAQGEECVMQYCEARGWEVLARNWRCGREGEIDLIVRDGCTVVAIEVKTRRGSGYGSPFEAITPQKQHTLRRLLSAWMISEKCHAPQIRIDAAAVLALPDEPWQIDYLQGVC